MLNDITRQNLDVFLMLDRAGVVGKDGPTHQGIYDIAMLSLMPNMKIMMARNSQELKGLIEYGLKHTGPITLRYPKLSTIDSEEIAITDESWEIVKDGMNGYIISYGPDVERILKLIEENQLDLTLINARFIRPLDEKLLNKIASDNKPILIYEQVVEASSLAMMITFYFVQNKFNIANINNMCFKTNEIVTHGDISEVLEYYKLGDKDILERIKEIWKD